MQRRAIDIIFSLILLGALSIPIVLVAFAVYISMGRPVFYKQARVGLNGVEFKILKFRTMTSPTVSENTIPDDELRVTKFGSFLRRSSIDELPNLFNILVGDMSFIGPRPLLKSSFNSNMDIFLLRHTVKPGITGWAQVNGRKLLDFDEKVQLDVWYINNRSVKLDLKIILYTLITVLDPRDNA